MSTAAIIDPKDPTGTVIAVIVADAAKDEPSTPGTVLIDVPEGTYIMPGETTWNLDVGFISPAPAPYTGKVYF